MSSTHDTDPARPQTDSSPRHWHTEPVSELIAHILATHHVPLADELARIEFLARKVARVHGANHPEHELERVLQLFLALRDDLLPHMEKEEEVLFPWILADGGPPPEAPIRVMLMEHDDVHELLRSLRALTGGYALPDGACRTWTALWLALEALEADLHEHIRLENEVLFPRALGR